MMSHGGVSPSGVAAAAATSRRPGEAFVNLLGEGAEIAGDRVLERFVRVGEHGGVSIGAAGDGLGVVDALADGLGAVVEAGDRLGERRVRAGGFVGARDRVFLNVGAKRTAALTVSAIACCSTWAVSPAVSFANAQATSKASCPESGGLRLKTSLEAFNVRNDGDRIVMKLAAWLSHIADLLVERVSDDVCHMVGEAHA
jgi:hypothetical protein